MSDTPRTDNEEMRQTQRFGVYMVKAEFARQLERELAEAKRDAARYEVVRKMTSDDFRKLYLRCIFENIRFDDEVDRIGGLK